jgi:hypothetical protein
MTMVASRLVVLAMVSALFCLPACLQPGEVEEPGSGSNDADAAPNGGPPGSPDAAVNPPAPGTPDAAPAADPTFTTNIYPLLQANAVGCP